MWAPAPPGGPDPPAGLSRWPPDTPGPKEGCPSGVVPRAGDRQWKPHRVPGEGLAPTEALPGVDQRSLASPCPPEGRTDLRDPGRREPLAVQLKNPTMRSNPGILSTEDGTDARARTAAEACHARSRRLVDPTTCDREYSPEECELQQAMHAYTQKSNRLIPTWSEVLEVIRDLGDRKGESPGGVGG